MAAELSSLDIPATVRGLRGGSRVAQTQAAAALALLSDQEAFYPAMVEAGAIPAAIHLLRRGRSATAEMSVLVMLGNLAHASEENAAAAAAAGATPLIMDRIRRGPAALLPKAVFALGNLTLCSEARRAAVAAGAVPLLLQALGRPRAHLEPLEQHVAVALKHLLMEPLPMDELRAAVPQLVCIVLSSDSKAQQAAACALYNAALLGSEARAAIAASAAIPVLLTLAVPRPPMSARLDSETAAVVMHALGHLAEGERERADILADADGVAFFQALQRQGLGRVRDIAELALAEAAAAQNLAAAAAQQQVADTGVTGTGVAGPAAAEQPPQQRRRQCAAPGCGAARGLRPCKGCLTARYCSPACQAAHWPEHKAECRRLREERAAAAAADEQAE